MNYSYSFHRKSKNLIKWFLSLSCLFSIALEVNAQAGTSIQLSGSCITGSPISIPYVTDIDGKPAYDGTGYTVDGMSPTQLSVYWSNASGGFWGVYAGGGTLILRNNSNTANPNSTNLEAWVAQGIVTCESSISITGDGTIDVAADVTAPTVSSVNSGKTNGTYGVGEVISIQVNFDEVVNVTGTPQITLETGTTDRTVNYTSGSGSATLIFNYTVQAGDASTDLDYMATTSLTLNGGTIHDAALNNATLTLATPGAANSLGANKALVIITQDPTWNGTVWSPSAPTASDNAIINGDYDTGAEGGFISNNLTVNSSFTLTIADGDSVETAGDLVNSGTILVQNNGSFIQTKATPANSGTGGYSVERETLEARAYYHQWSSPVQNTTVNTVFSIPGYLSFSFNGATQRYFVTDRNATLVAGSGFSNTGTSTTEATATYTFSDNLGFNSGDIMQSVNYNGLFNADSNWYFLGNPYPSGLDVNSFLTDNTSLIESTVYIWDSDGSDYSSGSADYATMGLAGAVSAGASGVAPTTAIVASCQGFFVQAKSTGNVTFSNSQRVRTNNTFFKQKTSNWERIWLGVEKENGARNEILLAFIPEADEDKDLYDAVKFSESLFVSLYSIGDFAKSGQEKLSIQGLPSLLEGRIVPLGIEAKEPGEFTFSLNHLDNFSVNMQILLHDAENNSLTDMRIAGYKVNLNKGEYNERFSLRFIDAKVTSIEDDLAETGISIFSHSKTIQINFSDAESAKSNIAVYDLTGKLIFAQSNQSELQANFELPKSGIYIIKVENSKGLVTKKLYVK